MLAGGCCRRHSFSPKSARSRVDSTKDAQGCGLLGTHTRCDLRGRLRGEVLTCWPLECHRWTFKVMALAREGHEKNKALSSRAEALFSSAGKLAGTLFGIFCPRSTLALWRAGWSSICRELSQISQVEG